MPRNNAVKSERTQLPPASQTRPKIASTRPMPVDETTPDTYAAIDAARLADYYDALRIKLAEIQTEIELHTPKVIEAMKAAGKTNFNTMHGRVSLLEKTEDKEVFDEKAAVALLEKHGIPLPPTLEVWIAQHSTEKRPLAMPMTTKKGMTDRLKFEMNK